MEDIKEEIRIFQFIPIYKIYDVEYSMFYKYIVIVLIYSRTFVLELKITFSKYVFYNTFCCVFSVNYWINIA